MAGWDSGRKGEGADCLRCLRHSLILAAMAAMPPLAVAQTPPVVEQFSASADTAYTWTENEVNVVQFEGPVSFQVDDVSMKADSAVLWLKRIPGAVFEQQDVEIALLGNAVLEQGSTRRSGDRLYVTARVRGNVRVSANQRTSRVRAGTPQYQVAQSMREQGGLAGAPEAGKWRLPTPPPLTEQSEKGPPAPVTAMVPTVTVRIKSLQSVMMGDGNIAIVLEGGATVIVHKSEAEAVELYAQRMVLLTRLKKFADVKADGKTLEMGEAVEGVYLDGDVQIDYIPKGRKNPESRLQADRAYYEIGTDRAVLTDAVLHTMDPLTQTPLVVRAATIKQLSQSKEHGEYRLQGMKLTSSTFASPSFAIAANKAYLTQAENADEYYGKRTSFSATNTRAEFWGLPVFWTPYSAGAANEQAFPLRAADIGSSQRFGTYVKTEWGLFELLGRSPPKGTDVSFRADYLTLRGPAGGVNAKYSGGFITDAEREPWNYEGRLETYFIDDHGTDKFGGDRLDVEPQTTQRGLAAWQHQHFLPDDWQVQLRTAWVSDPTFLEEYYPAEYRGDLPMESSLYLKHQRDTEALTLLGTTQPNGFVTSSEYAQEGLEIQRSPEVSYQRIGDSFGDDRFTFFSSNSAAELKMQLSDATPAELGYRPGTSPGIPVQGRYGVSEEAVRRGDTRQEIDYPLQVDRFRVVPYVMGRYTYYSDSIDGATQNRVFAGTGVRLNTAFWRVDDYAASELWDIHRVRHVIEPELHLFASGQSVDQTDLLIYDEQVDRVNDIQAVQLAMHQRWQTMRGGPGNWRSVDFLTWNTEGNFYANKPADAALEPNNFRGMFFPSAPETSVPRNSINTDLTWRASDSTAFLGDAQYNLDKKTLATMSGGVAVQRGDRMNWYVGNRYIQALDSNILSFLVNYDLSTRYTLGFGQSYDYGAGQNVTSNVSVLRHFDVFYMVFSVRYDDSTGERGLYVGLRPNYMAPGAGSNIIPSVTRGQ